MRPRGLRGTGFKDVFELERAVVRGMLGENAFTGSLADAPAIAVGEMKQNVGCLRGVGGKQDLFSGCEELVEPVPSIRENGGAAG
jgi:hypothetical protein